MKIPLTNLNELKLGSSLFPHFLFNLMSKKQQSLLLILFFNKFGYPTYEAGQRTRWYFPVSISSVSFIDFIFLKIFITPNKQSYLFYFDNSFIF